jgi:hypothetical protein
MGGSEVLTVSHESPPFSLNHRFPVVEPNPSRVPGSSGPQASSDQIICVVHFTGFPQPSRSSILGVGGCGNFLPCAALPAPVQLHAEVPVVQRGIIRAVARVMKRQGHVVAKEGAPGHLPPLAVPRHLEQALAGRHQ